MRMFCGLVVGAVLIVLLGARVQAQAPQNNAQLSSANCPAGCVTLSLAGYRYGAIQVNGTGTWTMQFEASIDGTNFTAVAMTPAGGGMTASSTTAAGLWNALLAGFNVLRVRISSYTSGTPWVYLQVS